MASVIEPAPSPKSPRRQPKRSSKNRRSTHDSVTKTAQDAATLRVDSPLSDDGQSALTLTTDKADEGKAVRRHKHAAPNAEERRSHGQLSWYSIIWLVAAHLIALAAPFYFSWTGLGIAVFLHWVTGSLGICLGYHRLLTHTGMKTHPWVRYTFATIGTLAGEGSPLDWIADHRKHHACSDQDGDPHSPLDGAWWSHMNWLRYHTHDGQRDEYLKRWAPDLYKEKGMRMMDYLFLPLHFASGVVLAAIGYAIGGWYMATSLVLWGLFVRLITVLHATWMVNSASHLWGYRNYETTDDSRNNWLVAIVAYGEGWHNNHHAYPRMAKHGHKWWEFDITWQAIRLLRAVGLVWDVVDYRNAKEKKAAAAAAAGQA